MKVKSHTYDLRLGFDLINDPIREINDFTFWHPPYHNIISYSGHVYGSIAHPSDISHIEDYSEFIKISNELLMKQFSSLKVGGRMAILVGDVKKNWKLYSMLLDLVKPDTLENIVIKEQHHCQSSKTFYNSKNSFIEIIHEYLIILRRTDPFIGNYKISSERPYDLRDSKKVTWKHLIYSVFEYEKTPLTIQSIYHILKNHKKAKNNQYTKEKIRQVLSQSPEFVTIKRGYYNIA